MMTAAPGSRRPLDRLAGAPGSLRDHGFRGRYEARAVSLSYVGGGPS